MKELLLQQGVRLLQAFCRNSPQHPYWRPPRRTLCLEELEGRLLLSTFTVTNTNDAGAGSLRQAILDANSAPGLDTIDFAIGSGAQTIRPQSALPTITGRVILDGDTQPGFSTAPLIELDGSLAGAAASGLTITGGGSTVRGLVINRFGTNGLVLNAGNNLIEGNYLGTDLTGTVARGNTKDGVLSFSPNNTIGGTTTAARNVISGNGFWGVEINATSGNLVEGNYIGTNAAGTAAIGNGGGLVLDFGGPNTVGGTTAAARNIISGNLSIGVALGGAGATGNVVEGNYIGTDVSGTQPLGNLSDGVSIDVTAPSTTVGGTAAGAGNLIANNLGNGVVVYPGGSRNSILGNSIYANSTLGIDLGNDGITANTGSQNAALANDGMNFPVFTSYTLAGTTLTVTGYVGTAPGQTTFGGARIEIFKSDNAPQAYGQGQTYLGFLTANASGNFSGSLTVAGLSASDKITATATDAAGNTSEFALNARYDSSTSVVSSNNPSVYGQAVTFTATVSALAPWTGTPTGTVTFMDGATSLGTVALSGGTASLTTSVLVAGSHTITVSYSGDTLFVSSTSAALTQSVTAAVLTVRANSTSKSYGAANPAFSDSITGFVNGDTASVVSGSASLSTTATTSSGVGSYAITAALGSLSAANYTFAFANGTLTVNPALLTVTANSTGKGYGAANPAFSDTISGFVNGDTVAVVSGSASLSTIATTGSGVGSYAITAAVGSLSAANYTFAFANGTLTVNPALLTVTANSTSRNYGAANPAFSDSITGFVNGDTASVVSGSASLTTSATVSSGVGSYAITANVGTLSAANYAFAFVNGTLTVNPALLTVMANSTSKNYGSVNPAFSDSISGFVNGDTVAVVSGSASLSTTATVNSGVGSYAITAAVGSLSAANYTFTFANGTLTVTPATLTVMANNATKLSGQPNPTFTDSITGFVKGDTTSVVSGSASLTTSATASSPVGTYTISAAPGSLSAANYTFALVNGTLTITSAPLSASSTSVVSSAIASVYGQSVTLTATVTAVAPATGTPTGTVTFLEGATTLGTLVLGGGTATLTTPALSVGSQSIIVRYSGDASFAASTSPSLTQNVTAATLLVAANNASKVVGQANPAFSDTITGFVNGDSAAVLGGRLTFMTPASTTSPVGTYAITPGGLTSGTYTITFVDGTLTIAPLPITISGATITPATGAGYTGAVAVFTDAQPGVVATDFTATITWGDGQTSAGTITADSSGRFEVIGANTYTAAGSYVVGVTLRDRGGVTAAAVGNARVSDPVPTSRVLPVPPTPALIVPSSGSVTFASGNSAAFRAVLTGLAGGDALLVRALTNLNGNSPSPSAPIFTLAARLTDTPTGSELSEAGFAVYLSRAVPASYPSLMDRAAPVAGPPAVAQADPKEAGKKNPDAVPPDILPALPVENPGLAQGIIVADPRPAIAPAGADPQVPVASAFPGTWTLQVEDSGSTPGVWLLIASGALLTAGYVILSNRASLWLLSLLTGQPLLWRRFDPVEVLFAWEEEKRRHPSRQQEPEETLQSIVQ